MMKFGEKFAKAWPEENYCTMLTDIGKKLLVDCSKIEKPNFGDKTLTDIVNASSRFPIDFGTNNCRIQNQPEERSPLIIDQLKSAYPIIHERVLYLYLKFLEHKCQYGNKCEKEIYTNLSITDFVQRLLTKRCVSFFGKNDKYLLITGEKGCSGFMTVGTEAETPPLLLKNVLSYDEVKLSAFLSVSSHSEFLNDGNRNNVGVIEKDKSKIERAGVVIGLIGARLSRRDVMEFQDIVISKTQNTIENGYGQNTKKNETRQSDYRHMWKSFYDEPDFSFDQVVKDGKRFGNSKNMNDIFDNLIMKKRYAISFDTLLLESEARCAAAEQRAYIHVVGIGLGVWKTAPQQEEIFLLTFTERLKELLPKLNHISFVHFSWFSMTKCGELEHGGIFKSDPHPDGGIRTFLSKRNPADKLRQPEHENVLLIVSYAWDGNALPGNEFWMKMLKSTGDSSTACSTLITEIHNPHINSQMVCGENLHLASAKYGVIHISEYSKNILNL
ncbi:uncharacterized protein LOC129920154 isoform X2 [Episyrphus balteatus]|uniref:uncharacterized protein LOC129920154 isoform X2 n=1 Tax=Episyrphus balteatus TaxID=286459 RepID=UPI0024858D1B|nr:uncharacterized protein LOC129920154 isoform X2 [Episyrphus balteatus]